MPWFQFKLMARVGAHDLSHDDRELHGTHADYFVEAGNEEKATDQFHTTVPIKVLEHYEITATELVPKTPALDLMSDEMYVAKKGVCCPVCRSQEIEGGPVEIDGDKATQPITCLNCRAEYDDIYKLFGYFNLVKDGEQLA